MGNNEHIKNISNIIRDYNTEDTFVSDFPFENKNNVKCLLKVICLFINYQETGD